MKVAPHPFRVSVLFHSIRPQVGSPPGSILPSSDNLILSTAGGFPALPVLVLPSRLCLYTEDIVPPLSPIDTLQFLQHYLQLVKM